MAPYDRLLGRDDAGNPVANKIPIHQFQAAVAEYSRAKLTGVQANSIITAVSGEPLTPAEQTEVQTLVNTVISIAVTGSTAAQGDGRSQRAMRLFEIDQVLLLADTGAPDRHRERERVEVAALLHPRAWTHASLAKRWFNPVKGEEFS
jgi:hypothetical protein